MKLDEFIEALHASQLDPRSSYYEVVVYDYDMDTDKHVVQVEVDSDRQVVNIFTK